MVIALATRSDVPREAHWQAGTLPLHEGLSDSNLLGRAHERIAEWRTLVIRHGSGYLSFPLLAVATDLFVQRSSSRRRFSSFFSMLSTRETSLSRFAR